MVITPGVDVVITPGVGVVITPGVNQQLGTSRLPPGESCVLGVTSSLGSLPFRV